jgi:hypothetical protein
MPEEKREERIEASLFTLWVVMPSRSDTQKKLERCTYKRGCRLNKKAFVGLVTGDVSKRVIPAS